MLPVVARQKRGVPVTEICIGFLGGALRLLLLVICGFPGSGTFTIPMAN